MGEAVSGEWVKATYQGSAAGCTPPAAVMRAGSLRAAALYAALTVPSSPIRWPT